MARITSETASKKIGSKYDMILVAARRARELSRGWNPHIKTDSGPIVTALKEIEHGHIGREYLLKPPNLSRKEKPSGS